MKEVSGIAVDLECAECALGSILGHHIKNFLRILIEDLYIALNAGISCIELLKSWGDKVTERRLALDEVIEASKNGTLDEAFGTGTAAVVSPMGLLDTGDQKMIINNGEIGEIAQKLYDTLTGIQWGRIEDTFGWTVKI